MSDELHDYRGIRFPSLWVVAHENGELCWNYCDPTPVRAHAEQNAANQINDVNGYGCKQSKTHAVIEYRVVEVAPMSTTPEPMTAERLKQIEEKALRGAREAFPIDLVGLHIIASEDVPALLAEVRRMREEGLQGHTIGPGGRRWGCEIDIEDLEAKLKVTENLLVERTSRMEKLTNERDEAKALLRRAAEAARAIRSVLFIGQHAEVALRAIDEFNALLSALAHLEPKP